MELPRDVRLGGLPRDCLEMFIRGCSETFITRWWLDDVLDADWLNLSRVAADRGWWLVGRGIGMAFRLRPVRVGGDCHS